MQGIQVMEGGQEAIYANTTSDMRREAVTEEHSLHGQEFELEPNSSTLNQHLFGVQSKSSSTGPSQQPSVFSSRLLAGMTEYIVRLLIFNLLLTSTTKTYFKT